MNSRFAFVLIGFDVLMACVLGGGLMPAVFANELFSYNAPSFPSAHIEECEAQSGRIAAALAQTQGVSIYRSKCSLVSEGLFNIEIQYVAPSYIEPVSTYIRSGSLRYDGYSTLESCQADLAGEVGAFTRNTGLNPFISYCAAIKTNLNEKLFLLVVEAFGEPRARPYLAQDVLAGQPLMGYEALATSIRQALFSDIDVSTVFFLPDMGGSVMNVRYYATKPYNYYSDEMIRFVDTKTCREIERRLSEILSRGRQQPLASYCSSPTYSRLISFVSLKPIGFGSIKLERARMTFDTIAECDAEIQDVESLFRDQLKRDVLGSICVSDVGGAAAYVAYNLRSDEDGL
jgi:hypothetical protein